MYVLLAELPEPAHSSAYANKAAGVSSLALWTGGRGVGLLISAAAHSRVGLTTHFMLSPYNVKATFYANT